jgi:hypothetical protein
MNETTISANFINSFKTGDNIVYNLKVLKELYVKYEDGNSVYLLKPIILTNASVIEAVLHDFHRRIKYNFREGVHSLTQEVIDHIRDKQIDEFEKYINQAKKHDFFNLSRTTFYEKLHKLRKIRNRVHIKIPKVILQ